MPLCFITNSRLTATITIFFNQILSQNQLSNYFSLKRKDREGEIWLYDMRQSCLKLIRNIKPRLNIRNKYNLLFVYQNYLSDIGFTIEHWHEI